MKEKKLLKMQSLPKVLRLEGQKSKKSEKKRKTTKKMWRGLEKNK
jgi:hypothetical protein